MSIEPPIGIALIVCDQILEESGTRKKSLLGVFNSVACRSFPATIHKVCVFVSLTNLNGKSKTLLRCSNETKNMPLMAVEGIADSNNPNSVLELGFEFESFAFPQPGLHIFEFLCDGIPILSSRFNVMPQQNIAV